MNPLRRLAGYAAHPDPVTAACNRIALVVAWNQPFYPLYLLWLVGGDWRSGCWTFLSTPFFAGVPALARRHPLAGRALLPVAGIANGLLSARVFGERSGVELFLLPCVLIALLAFLDAPRVMAGLLAAIVATAALHGHYGAPLARFADYAAFRRVNGYSVAALCAVVLWSLIRARASTAPRGSPPRPPAR